MKKYLFFLSLGFIYHFSCEAQWTKLTGNSYQGIDLTDIYANGNNIIAVGTKFSNFEGQVFSSSDGGLNWNVHQVLPQGYFYKTIAFKDADTGFIGGYGSISFWLKTTNGGQTWQYELSDTVNSGINDMLFTDSKHGYASGYGHDQFSSGICYWTSDGGTTWYFEDSVNLGVLDTLPLDYIQFVDPSTGFGRPDFLQKSHILKTIDSGKTWTIIYTHSKSTSSMHFWDAVNGLLTDVSGDVYKTTNGGATWTMLASNAFGSAAILSMSFISSNLGFAVGSGGKIFRTSDGGNTWAQEVSNTGKTLWRIRFFDNRAYVSGMDGTILRSATLLSTPRTERQEDILVYPNPASGSLTVTLPTGKMNYATIYIYSMEGRIVAQSATEKEATILDIRGLPAGSYFLVIRSGTRSFKRLFTKK